MKKTLLALAIIFGSTEYIFSQESEIRVLESFNKITISGNSKVYLTQATPQEVRVESKNKMEDVNTRVSNNTLHIDGKPSSIYITIPELTQVFVSGFGEVKSEGTFNSNEMKIEISGNGKIILPLEVEMLDVDVSGFGKLKLSGVTRNLKLGVSGNATIDAENLKTNTADVEISGVAKASVDVSDELNLSVSGVGSVYYKSEPKKITRNVSGIDKYGLLKNPENDTTTVTIGRKRIVIIGGEEKTVNTDDNDDENFSINVDTDEVAPKKPKKSRSHWAGIDLGFNNYFSDGTSTSIPDGYDFLDLNPGKSLAVGINLWKFDIPIYKRYVMLTTGIGLTLNNYRFNSDRTLTSDTNMVVSQIDLDKKNEVIEYKKNKLAVNYITAPLLIQFNSDSHLKKSFHLAAGLLFSYKYNSHLKLVYDEDGDKQKSKRRDDFNIEPFRYDFTVRLGYRNYTLFANYAMSELFKDKKGPTLHPFTVGIQLAGW